MSQYGLLTFHTSEVPEVEFVPHPLSRNLSAFKIPESPRFFPNHPLHACSANDREIFSIVFVHGLRGHVENTWKVKDGPLWPKDFLAADVENSRIMSFGYDSKVVHSDTAEVTQTSLESEARSLCSQLNAARNTSDSVLVTLP